MLHIGYKPENRVFAAPTASDRLWEFVRFAVITGLIFVAVFLFINFSAYRQIFADFFDPAAQAQAQAALEKASGRLPTAGPVPLLPATKPEIRKTFAWVDYAVAPTDDRLVIPKLGKSVPLVHLSAEHIEGENWADLEKQIQGGLRQGVVHYPGTANPGQFGNVFLTGHSSYYPWDPGKFKDIFALLGKLEPGDRYYVYFKQIKYTYEVREKFEVPPSDVTVLAQPKDKKIATLMTCTPVGTTLRRLIIRSEQVS